MEPSYEKQMSVSAIVKILLVFNLVLYLQVWPKNKEKSLKIEDMFKWELNFHLCSRLLHFETWKKFKQ